MRIRTGDTIASMRLNFESKIQVKMEKKLEKCSYI